MEVDYRYKTCSDNRGKDCHRTSGGPPPSCSMSSVGKSTTINTCHIDTVFKLLDYFLKSPSLSPTGRVPSVRPLVFPSFLYDWKRLFFLFLSPEGGTGRHLGFGFFW